jgi:hypothetical protein
MSTAFKTACCRHQEFKERERERRNWLHKPLVFTASIRQKTMAE